MTVVSSCWRACISYVPLVGKSPGRRGAVSPREQSRPGQSFRRARTGDGVVKMSIAQPGATRRLEAKKRERDGKRDGERPVTAPRQYYERCSRVFQCHLMPTRPFNTFQFYVSFPIFSRHARGRNRLRTVDLYCLRESVCLDHVTGDNAIRLFV